MSNRDNRSFLDKLLESLAYFAILIAILSIFVYLLSEVYDAFRYGKWDKILKWTIIFFCIWVFLKFIEHSDKIISEKKETIEDNRSGAKIWEDNMKNYDSGRGY